MRRVIVVLLALVVMLASTSSQGSTNHAWVATHGGLDHDEPYDVATSPDGTRVFVTGSTEPYIEGTTARASSDWSTVAYDAETGEKVWSAEQDGPARGPDHAYAVAVSPDSATVVVAGDMGVGQLDAGDGAIVAYDAPTGEVRWSRTIDGTDEIAPDLIDTLAITPDGKTAVIVGSVGTELEGGWVPPLSRLDLYVAALSVADGTILWESRRDGSGSGLDHATGVAISSDGTRAAIVAQSEGASGWMNSLTMLVRVSDGSLLWHRERDIESYDVPLSVSFTPDDQTLFVAGTADGTGRQERSFVERLSTSSGASAWVATIPSRNYHENLMALSPSADAIYIVGANRESSGRGWQATALRAADGSVAWKRTFGNYGSAVDVDKLPDGTVIVAGDYEADDSPSGYDIVTRALSPVDGSVRWTGRYDGGLADDRLKALAVTPDGRRIFAVGDSWRWESSSFDYAIVGHGPGCANGSREEGIISRAIDTTIEPLAAEAHDINCTVASSGL